MKKRILVLMMGLLMLSVNLYAAGDLIVNGKLGAGTSTLDGKINAESTDVKVINATAIKSADATWFTGSSVNAQGNAATNAAIVGLSMSATSNTTGASTGLVVGITGVAKLTGSGNVTGTVGFLNSTRLQSSAGDYNITSINGQELSMITGSQDSGNHNVTNYYGVLSQGVHNGSGTVSGTDWRHAYFTDLPNYGGTVTNVSGLWIDKQTYGTNNYGIVLNGDGAGANIVFGASQQASIYSSSGLLYATDMNGNITQFSPHDPETGEWIYYSKNTKTGVVKRVNMEKLVKAVEKLTGETFMIETLEAK